MTEKTTKTTKRHTKAALIPVRFPQTIVDSVDNIAAESGLNRSAVLRQAAAEFIIRRSMPAIGKVNDGSKAE